MVPHKSFITYETSEETNLKSIFETNCDRKYFNSSKDRDRFKTKMFGTRIFEAMKPELEYLRANFIHEREKPGFDKFQFKMHFLDIEVCAGSSFPFAHEAKFPINLITVYDTDHQKYFTWALTKLDCEKFRDDSEIFLFRDEKSLLRSYLKWHSENYPDCIVTWNGIRFDIPYIINRCINILDEDEHLIYSPENNIYIQENVDAQTKEEYHRIYIKGITQFDYLILYRDKFLYKSPTNYSLGSIGQNELGIGKIELAGRLQDIWKTNFQKFYEYNIRDVEILIKLDQKLQLIYLARKICNIGLVQYEKIYSTTAYLINALSMFVEEKTGKIFCADVEADVENEKYEGAFVFPVEPCYLDNGIATIDVNSLYPNTMIALNLGPETKVGKLIKENDVYKLNVNNKIKELTRDQVKKLLTEKCTLSKNNVLFLKSTVQEGVVSAFLKYYYDQRKLNKAEWKKVQRKLEKCKDETEKAKLKIEDMLFDRKDFAYKVGFLNSLYGMFGSRFSPLHDIDCAEAITITGQFITKTAIEYVDTKLKERYGTEKATKSSDTDSCDKDSIVRTNLGIFKIEDFWNLNFMQSKLTNSDNGHEIMPINKKYKVLTFNDKTNKPEYAAATKIIRHKVKKEKFKITCGNKSVIVTGDHSCMVVRNNKLIAIKAKEILPTDKIIVLD